MPDVGEILQHGNLAQDLMVVRRLVGVPPTQGFQRGAIGFPDPDQRVVQRKAGDVRAAFDRAGLLDVTPGGRAVDIAEHTFDEQRFDVAVFVSKRPDIVADQPVLQGAHPCRIDQRFGQVFAHFAVPVGQHGQGLRPAAFRRAFGCCLSGKPQVFADQRQKRSCRKGNRIKLRLDKAFAGVNLAALHQGFPAFNALRVAPFKADMQREGAVDGFVVGVADDAATWRDKGRVRRIRQHALPAVFRDPARRGHPALTLMVCVPTGHLPDGLHRDFVFVDQGQVLGRGHVSR